MQNQKLQEKSDFYFFPRGLSSPHHHLHPRKGLRKKIHQSPLLRNMIPVPLPYLVSFSSCLDAKSKVEREK